MRICVCMLLEGEGWCRGCIRTCHFKLANQLPTRSECHNYTHTHIYMHVHKHSRGCLQMLGLRYTCTVTINDIHLHTIMCFAHTMKWDYCTWGADAVITGVWGLSPPASPADLQRSMCVWIVTGVCVTLSSPHQAHVSSTPAQIGLLSVKNTQTHSFSLWKWNDASVTLIVHSYSWLQGLLLRATLV